MIMAWTLFQDSPTLLLCDHSDSFYASKHLSYKMGIYIFVPLTFLSVFIILVFYGRILYLVQKHVKSTEKTLGGDKSGKRKTTAKKNNKVAPKKQRESTAKVLDVMVNNFMPPGFSIIDTDLRGSRISLASIGKNDNDNKEDEISPLDAYNENSTTNRMTPKETDLFKVKESNKTEIKKNKGVSTISHNVDILPTIRSASSLNKSSGQNNPTCLGIDSDDPIRDYAADGQILSVSNLETSNFKTNHAPGHVECVTKVANRKSNLNDTHNIQQVYGKRASVNTPSQGSGFCRREDLKQLAANSTEHDANDALSKDKISPFACPEAIKCNSNVITNLPSTETVQTTSRMMRDCEFDEPNGNPSAQFSMCTGDHETITKVDTIPLEIEGYMNKSFSLTDEDTAAINGVGKGSNNGTNGTNSRYGSNDKHVHLTANTSKGEFSVQTSNQGATTVNTKQNRSRQDVGRNKAKITTISVMVPNSECALDETDTTEVNSKLSPVLINSKKREDVVESAMPVIMKKKTTGDGTTPMTAKKGGVLTEKMSVVKIYDADGQTVKAKTSRQTVAGDICVINTSNKIKGKRKLEAKSAKKAAVVLVTFLIAWLPFPIVIVVSWFLDTHNTEQIRILTSAYVVSMTLSLLAASVNPVVYGAINKQFSKEFKKMLKKCKQSCTKKLKQ